MNFLKKFDVNDGDSSTERHENKIREMLDEIVKKDGLLVGKAFPITSVVFFPNLFWSKKCLKIRVINVIIVLLNNILS